jgi:hypothetical protein
MPVDVDGQRSAGDCWIELPEVSPPRQPYGRVPMPSTHNTYAAQTVDDPRPPPQVYASSSEPQSWAIRFMDWCRDIGPSLMLCAVLLLAIGLASYAAYRSDQRVKVVEQQNQDLRQVQIDQQQRIAQLESKSSGN